MLKVAVVVQEGNKWLVKTGDESRTLGTHDNPEDAYKQLYAIHKSQERQKKSSWDQRYAMDKGEFGKAMGYYCNVGDHYDDEDPVCDTEGCRWIGYPKNELMVDNNGKMEGVGNSDHSPSCQFACAGHSLIKCKRCGDVSNPSYRSGHKFDKCHDCLRELNWEE